MVVFSLTSLLLNLVLQIGGLVLFFKISFGITTAKQQILFFRFPDFGCLSYAD